MNAHAPLLAVRGLTTVFDIGSTDAPRPVVEDVSFDIQPGETLGLVGESGSGKSITALSVLRLLPPRARTTAGSVQFQGRDLLTLSEADMCAVRGAGIGLVFQEPMAALNPVLRVGTQVAESLVVHGLASGREARARAVALLEAVGIPDPQRRVDDYPHQFSGGMRQRVMLACALACHPPLVIADEPTTALDVTIQAQVLDLLRERQRTSGMALLLITHDLGVIATMADRVAVMYAGRLVETGPVRDVLRAPAHPYTRALLASIPGGTPGSRLRAIAGTVPAPGDQTPGCAFAPRCPERQPHCATVAPPMTEMGPGRAARCVLVRDSPHGAGA